MPRQKWTRLIGTRVVKKSKTISIGTEIQIWLHRLLNRPVNDGFHSEVKYLFKCLNLPIPEFGVEVREQLRNKRERKILSPVSL
jgi:hypothetical protein